MPNADHFRVWAIMVAAALAAGILALVTLVEPADAAFPGATGNIVFSSNRETATNPIPPGQTQPDREIFTMNKDGTKQKKRTNNPDLDTYPAWQPIVP